MSSYPFTRPGLAALVSGLLLFAAFPPLEWGAAAWAALVPLLIVAARSAPAPSFRAGLVAGLAFYLPSLAWLTRVSWPGWLLVSAYCALYLALFSMAGSWIMRPAGFHRGGGAVLPAARRPGGPREGWAMLCRLFFVPAAWVGLEYLRSILFTGFAWNPLGVTQAGVLPLIQCAEWGGVYAVSFLVVMANAALALTLLRLAGAAGPARRVSRTAADGAERAGAGGRSRSWAWARAPWPVLVCLAVLILAWSRGAQAIERARGQPGAPLRLALVQLNIPQFEKWTEECWGAIEARLRQGTTAAVRRHRPELVVWPETAVPTFVRGVPSTEKLIAELLELGVPILVGTMDFEETGAAVSYFNSSFLFDPQRGLIQKYAKQHLVIFGEYVPLAKVFPFLRRVTPIEESFTPGRSQTVFRLDASPRAFAVLICFEDTVAALARRAVRAGARLLVNQTNDAWFDPSWAPRQHMLQGVFRCVENRVPAVRSTNTGITCFIDRTGRVSASLPPTRGPGPVPECLAQTVSLPGPGMPLTFYTQHGDLFAGACLGLAILALGAARFRFFS